MSARPGRSCPVHYRYAPTVFATPAAVSCEVLYVVGGLYGNELALNAVLAAFEAEAGAKHLVFNGDFNWLNVHPGLFQRLNERVLCWPATRGNVETEIARATDIGAGCGCAYPASVAEDLVRRSNEILVDLRRTANIHPGATERLAALPMHLVAEVGGLRVGIVHGDATSLAGWSFAHDVLDEPNARTMLNAVRRAARVDVFASSHTCAAVLRDVELRAGRLTIVNNGAAGMPNFSGGRFGLISRIATTPSPHRPLYGMVRDGVHIDAIAIAYDGDAFLDRFLARWPAGSAAHASYFQRITAGPDYAIERARPKRAAIAVTSNPG